MVSKRICPVVCAAAFVFQWCMPRRRLTAIRSSTANAVFGNYMFLLYNCLLKNE